MARWQRPQLCVSSISSSPSHSLCKLVSTVWKESFFMLSLRRAMHFPYSIYKRYIFTSSSWGLKIKIKPAWNHIFRAPFRPDCACLEHICNDCSKFSCFSANILLQPVPGAAARLIFTLWEGFYIGKECFTALEPTSLWRCVIFISKLAA